MPGRPLFAPYPIIGRVEFCNIGIDGSVGAAPAILYEVYGAYEKAGEGRKGGAGAPDGCRDNPGGSSSLSESTKDPGIRYRVFAGSGLMAEGTGR